MDNLELERWRQLGAAEAVRVLADYAKQDATFVPRHSQQSTRWHITISGREFELLCTGPKFLDTRAGIGGGGAVDLAMYLNNVGFKQATELLRSKGL